MKTDPRDWNEHDRREFLKIAGASAFSAAMATGLPIGAQETQTLKATVGIAKNPSIAKAVSQAVEMAGGMGFIKDGQRVLVKPNQVAPTKHPATTNPEVLYEVIKLAAQAGGDPIFLSDRCFQTYPDGEAVMKQTGHWDAAKQAELDLGGGVKVYPIEFHEAQEHLKPGSPIWRDIYHPLAKNYIEEDGTHSGFRLAELLFQVDHVINVPCCKVHNQAWFTMSMKAFVGMSDPATTRRYFHAKAGKGVHAVPGEGVNRYGGPFYMTEADSLPISRLIAELNLGLTPALNIIDATRPIYAGGHIAGESKQADVIIASTDRIAADVTGISLLRTLGAEKRLHSMSPWKIPMIRHARKLRLGVNRREDLTVKHEGMDNIEELLEQMA